MLKTTHNLPFEVAPWEVGWILPNEFEYQRFKIGTCDGLWGYDNDNYYILVINNESPGNGHLSDVFEWFEASCKRDKKNLIIQECFNLKFKTHLLNKRGFSILNSTDVIKKFL